jgi:aspartyl-tRNA(Asn)/glutamyl-tRNA(Gln) amidotransferase subunit B
MSSKGLSSPVRSLLASRGVVHQYIRRRALPVQKRRQLTSSTSHNEEPSIPLRKQLKDEAKQKRLDIRSGAVTQANKVSFEGWELTVGIEIHAELNTARKLFSEAPTSSPDAAPNSNIALFDLAYPGSQPHFQHATLLPALRAAIALNCDIQRKSTFDRKHYLYQDQPAGYQITQYYGTNATMHYKLQN